MLWPEEPKPTASCWNTAKSALPSRLVSMSTSYPAGYSGIVCRCQPATANWIRSVATSSRTPAACRSITAAFEPGEPGVPGAGFGIFGLVPVRPKTCTAPSSTFDALLSVICSSRPWPTRGGHVGRTLRQHGPAQVQRLVGPATALTRPSNSGPLSAVPSPVKPAECVNGHSASLRRVDRHLDVERA